jgi:hypothetical protein
MHKLYTRISRRLALTLGSSTPWIFLFGLLAVGLMTEGLATVFETIFDDNPWFAAWFTVAVGVVLLLATLLLFNLPQATRDWLKALRKGHQKPDVTVVPTVEPRRGLIALVSRGTDPPVEAAIEYHFQGNGEQPGRLQFCWLLTGPDTDEQSSQVNAQRLQQIYAGQGVRGDIWNMRDADDPQQVFQTVQNIYRIAADQFSLSAEEIIADFTGGTKCMAAGMVLACAAGDWDLQYLKPTQYDEFGRAIKGSPVTPILVDVDFFMGQDRAGGIDS